MATFTQTLNGDFLHDREVVEDFLNVLQQAVYDFEDVVIYSDTEPDSIAIQTAYASAIGSGIPVPDSVKAFWFNPTTGKIEDVKYVQTDDSLLSYVDVREHDCFVLYSKHFDVDYVGNIFVDPITTNETYDGILFSLCFRSTYNALIANTHFGFYNAIGNVYYAHTLGYLGSTTASNGVRVATDGIWTSLNPVDGPANLQAKQHFKGFFLLGMGFGRDDVVKSWAGFEGKLYGNIAGVTSSLEISANASGGGIEEYDTIDEFSIDTITGVAEGTQVLMLGLK